MGTYAVKFGVLDLSEAVESFEEAVDTRLNAMQVPKRHGVLVSEVPVLAARIIRTRGRIQSNTFENLRETLDLMGRYLNAGRQKLTNWTDRFIYAYKHTFAYGYVPGSAMTVADFSLDFMCDDPFWYSQDSADEDVQLRDTDTSVGGGYYKKGFTLSNDGTVFVYPIITVTASIAPITRVIVRNLTNGRTFQYDGIIASGKSLVIDVGRFSVLNDGVEDLTNWNGFMTSLDVGDNSMEVEGSPADYNFVWTPRHF